jgi:His/Glu/Gln/Arg/opine family amino acid ABC transporter permease subunit
MHATGTGRHQHRLGRVLLTIGVLGGGLALLHLLGRYEFDYALVWGQGTYAERLGKGLLLTLGISLGGMAIAVALGAIGAAGRVTRRWVPNQLAALYVEIVRGTPFLVQILVVYYGLRPVLRSLGWPTALIGDVPLAILTLGVFGGAYVTEIIRGAIESVPAGQVEAARAQGLTGAQTVRFVVLPQALPAMVPALTGQLVNLVKDSSLFSVVAVMELMKQARAVVANTYAAFEVYVPLAFLYLAITYPLGRLARRLEERAAA